MSAGATGALRSPRRAAGLVLAGLGAWVAVYAALGPAAGWLAHGLMRLDPASPLGSAVAFFLFEAPKVLMLLVLVVFAVGVVRSYFTPARTRALLAGRREATGNVVAAALGTVTPFCSCSAVPLFIGFVAAGVPLGVTLSFLIAAPMVNEVALALLLALFGWKVAALYLATGLGIAIGSGFVLGRLRMERHVESWVYEVEAGGSAVATEAAGLSGRARAGLDAVREIVGKVWPWVLGGIAVGAAIHGWVPRDVMAGILGEDAWWSVPAAVLLGVPMYSNAAGIVPVVHALIEKGAALGTVLAFMMAVIGLSLPETVILRKVLRPPLIAAFLGIVAAGIVAVGLVFNLLL